MTESKLVLDVWNALYEYIPATKRDDAAIQFIKTLEDHLTDMNELVEELQGEDDHLDAAFETLDLETEDEDEGGW